VITVLEPGLSTTVQDLGRYGYQRFGVSPAGALDAPALRLANAAVGNEPGAAGLEITLKGPRLRFERPALIALAGAELSACLDGEPVPVWQAQAVPAGAELSFGRRIWGCRAYLAVAGGIAVKPVLGSRSTHLPSGLGGRALCAGDTLPVGRARGQPARAVAAGAARALYERRVLRVVPGPHDDLLVRRDALFEGGYRLSPRCNRMGCELDGPGLAVRGAGELDSHAVVTGAIQVPPRGAPIVLLADRQTTGGYPIAGVVARADLHLIAQLRPGDEVGFEPVALEQAQRALRAQERRIAALIAKGAPC
jgi:antagonist of KipI